MYNLWGNTWPRAKYLLETYWLQPLVRLKTHQVFPFYDDVSGKEIVIFNCFERSLDKARSERIAALRNILFTDMEANPLKSLRK